jgi:hypothetical protein
MTLDLHVDGAQWRKHVTQVAEQSSNLVPVIKGNGYGFTNPLLAREAERLKVPFVAVGAINEIAVVAAHFSGKIILLTPTEGASVPSSTVLTISSITTLRNLSPDQDFILEIETPMHRHGIALNELASADPFLHTSHFLGFSLHLPIAPMEKMWLHTVLSMLPSAAHIWISHAHNLGRISKNFPEMTFHERVGTHLWLGNPKSLRMSATVIDKHEVNGVAGYRLRKAHGTLLVVSGGTSHGVGLSAPSSDFSLIGRIKVVVKAYFELFGILRSPYSWKGKGLRFLEPPHMHSSLVLFNGKNAPKIGDELLVTLRNTTTSFDRILGLDS